MSATKVPMRATARQCYGGRWLRVGEEFNADDEADAADLEALHLAQREVAREGKKSSKGQYNRRDMRAKE